LAGTLIQALTLPRELQLSAVASMSCAPRMQRVSLVTKVWSGIVVCTRFLGLEIAAFGMGALLRCQLVQMPPGADGGEPMPVEPCYS
jgi:hypothetical protein